MTSSILGSGVAVAAGEVVLAGREDMTGRCWGAGLFEQAASEPSAMDADTAQVAALTLIPTRPREVVVGWLDDDL